MLHLYLGSTQANRDSDDFRLREAYRALRARLDTDGMLDLNTAELPARGLTPEALAGQASTVPFLASARVIVVEGLIVSLGAGRGVADDKHFLTQNGVPAERNVPGGAVRLQALPGLEPLSVSVDEADQAGFDAEHPLGHPGNAIETFLGRRVEYAQRLQAHQSLGFVER